MSLIPPLWIEAGEKLLLLGQPGVNKHFLDIHRYIVISFLKKKKKENLNQINKTNRNNNKNHTAHTEIIHILSGFI